MTGSATRRSITQPLLSRPSFRPLDYLVRVTSQLYVLQRGECGDRVFESTRMHPPKSIDGEQSCTVFGAQFLKLD